MIGDQAFSLTFEGIIQIPRARVPVAQALISGRIDNSGEVLCDAEGAATDFIVRSTRADSIIIAAMAAELEDRDSQGSWAILRLDPRESSR